MSLPGLNPYTNGASEIASPILTNLPSATRSLERRYADPAVTALPPNVLTPLQTFETQRVARGGSPLTARQYAAVAKSLSTGKPAHEQPNKSLGAAFLSDLAATVSSLPKLPAMVLNEIKSLPDLPALLPDALDASNPIQALGNVANLPGIRMIPGSFIAGRFGDAEHGGGGGFEELAQHPLFTALDVLPVAHQAAKLTPVARAYTEQVAALNKTRVAEAVANTGDAATALLEKTPRPIQTVLTRKLVEGEVVPNRLGSTLVSLGDAFGATNLGRAVNSTFRERGSARLAGRYDADLQRAMVPGAKMPTHFGARDITAETGAVRGAVDMAREIDVLANGDPARKALLQEAWENPRLPDGTPTASELVPGLTDKERALMARGRESQADLARMTEGEFTGSFRNEVYTLKQAQRLHRLDAKVSTLRALRAGRESIDPLLAPIRDIARTQPVAARALVHLDNGNYTAALNDLRALNKRGKYEVAIPDELIEQVDGFRTMARKAKIPQGKITAQAVTRAQQALDKSIARIVPARFSAGIEAETSARLSARAREVYAHNPDVEHLSGLAAEGIFSQVPDLMPEVRTIQKEVRESWQALRDEGFDPIFYHRTSPSAADRLTLPRVTDKPVTPGFAKARAWDATPYNKDLGVALTDQAMQLLTKRGSDAFVDELAAGWGKTRDTLEAEFLPRAQVIADSRGIPLRAALDSLIDARYTPFSPGDFLPWRQKPGAALQATTDTMIPRAMAENVKRMFEPPLPKLTAAFDPVMRVFRTSVLPLAPRWHFNNTLGGLVMVMAEDPRALLKAPEVFRAFREKSRALKAGDEFSDVLPRGGPPPGAGTLPKELTVKSPLPERLGGTFDWLGGQTRRRLYDQARASRLASGAKSLVEKSYSANQLVDDFYRSMIYLNANERALSKLGMTAHEAEAAGAAAVRKSFMAWDEMTPMERSVMRSVIPFYGFSSFILKRVMQYPWDHPLRAQVMSTLARTEQQDSLTGLPERFRDMFFLGDPTSNAPTKALSLAFNPFGDTASMLTWQGFLGQLNPVITGTLESLGVDILRGGPMLYPDLTYDPETGRMVARGKGNLLTNIATSVAPQAQALMAFVGQNAEFNELLARDPDAAGRQLRSLIGLPTITRDIDTGEEIIKAEMARFEAQDLARRDALRTGNLDAARRFPALRAYLDQIEALRASGQLADYTPGAAPNPGILGALGGAVLQRG